MVFAHTREQNNYSFTNGDPNAVAMQNNLLVASPGSNYTLVRTRMMIEFRIFAYSLTDSASPPEFWWDGIYPVVGVEFIKAPSNPGFSNDPIGGQLSDEWVIWQTLPGEIEFHGITPAGFDIFSRVYRLPGNLSESFAKHRPFGSDQLWIYLAWNFNDPQVLINRTHASFDLVYDLSVTYGIDFFFQPH